MLNSLRGKNSFWKYENLGCSKSLMFFFEKKLHLCKMKNEISPEWGAMTKAG